MDEPFVLNFAPTGMVSKRSHTPNLPVKPDENARDAERAVKRGRCAMTPAEFRSRMNLDPGNGEYSRRALNAAGDRLLS
jgi:hypothetical protein